MILRFLKKLLSNKPYIDTQFQKTVKNSSKYIYGHTHNSIRKILRGHHRIKIGQSGNPKRRKTYDDYNGIYDKMYLIVKSKNRDLISNIEKRMIIVYNDVNENKAIGGGNMTSTNGYYYLYVVARY